MYRVGQKIIQIDLEHLTSHDGRWQVDSRLNLALPPGSWDALEITDTLDYGALAGQLRFILDCVPAAHVEATITAYAKLLPQLFPALTITGHKLTITSTELLTSREGKPLWLGTMTEFGKTTKKMNPASAVLICSGERGGDWFLSPYADASSFEASALCLAIPYTGYLPTQHFKTNYYTYPPYLGETYV